MSDVRYFPPECTYTIEGNRIVTDGSVKNKVSGTNLAGILGQSPYKTPFMAACELLGLVSEDISDKPAVKVGRALEPAIIRFAEKAYPQYGTFCSAEEVYQKRVGKHSEWVSDFEDDVFAGHVDGIVFDDNGNDMILEIKTANITSPTTAEKWKEGVPGHYQWQVALYNHFISKKDKAIVILGEVNDATYKDMTSWIPSENNVLLFEMPIDDEEVERNLALVREWYSNFIQNGVTPEYDPKDPRDVAYFEHLKLLAATEEEISPLIDKYGQLDEEIAEYDAVIGAKREEKEFIKTKLKEYFEASPLSKMDSKNKDFFVSIGRTSRTKWLEEDMIADGIDVNKYKVKTTSKTFSVKRKSGE